MNPGSHTHREAPAMKGGAPKPNKQMEALQMAVLRKQLRDSQKFEMPQIETPPPPLPAAPPPSSSSADVVDAQEQARRDALKRKGFASTLFAGETGRKSTLLGA